MQKSFLKSYVIAAIVMLALVLAPIASSQVTTSAMTGLIVSADGKPASGVKVTAQHMPTNASFTATTNADGRYYLRNLPVGGPYTVSILTTGASAKPQESVETELGNEKSVDFALTSEVLQLETFKVTGAADTLDSNLQGNSTVLARIDIDMKATTQRSFADVVSATPTITLRSLSGDREEAQITALGQNNRYNSWMIDGNRINDIFGLNATGLASFFNPLALDTVEQFDIKTATPDVRYAGFTGATLNVVTKSGTNDFHGDAYYLFSGDHIAGLQGQGPDARTLVQSGVKVVPKLERTTKGITLGGPIWKDHLWFFIGWDKFDRVGAPNQAGLPTVGAADLTTINARIAQITKVKYGAVGGNANSQADEEKKLAKIDWKISDKHRLSVRYSTTEGQVPQFGTFTTTSFGSGLNNNSAFTNLVGGAATAFDSHFYSQIRQEKSYSAQAFSSWTPDFSTDFRYSKVKQTQTTPTASIAPEIRIFGVNGVNQGGATITNGVVVLGTERFRHGNQIDVDSRNYTFNADYHRGNVTYSAGFDIEKNDLANLFRQFSYGVFDFASPADFLADNPRFFQRNFTDLALKKTYAEVSDYTQSAVYAKAKWDYSNRLNIQAGIRYDWTTSELRPTFNQQFLTDTGMRNDGTVDGAKDISPRIGFNYSLDAARKTQMRGTLGYYLGRSPWVFWSNSFGNTGSGTFSSLALPTGGLTGYLANSFDPANPFGTASQTGVSRAEINLADNETHMPSLWRGTLAVDHKLGFLDSVVRLEIDHSVNDNSLFITNDNLRIAGTAADGRVYFAGNPSTLANARYANYLNIYHLRNVRAGTSTYVIFEWERRASQKNKWGFKFDYTRGRATEGQASGQTTASGMWQRNAVFNQSTQDRLFVETGTSDFEISQRVQLTLTRNFEFIRNYRTVASLYYEGRSGSAYSFAYSNDMNNDGMAGNDLVAVPSGPSDARFDLTALTSAQQAAMFAFFDTSGLSKYAGSYAPKNSFSQPWVSRLDLKFTQHIPLHFKSAKMEFFMDFTNFGNFLSKKLFNYVERAPSAINDVFERRLVGNASINTADGKIRVTTFSPTNFLIDNTMSRWRMQVGAKISF